MAVIATQFLREVLAVYERIQQGIAYPFFDPAAMRYEALRAVSLDAVSVSQALDTFGLTGYQWRQSRQAFQAYGIAGLIGLECQQLLEPLPLETERMVFVLKCARASIPATKMRTILKGFGIDTPLGLMRRLYASYGWAHGTREDREDVDFFALNLKVGTLCELRRQERAPQDFFSPDDRLQPLLELFRTVNEPGVISRYRGSRVSFAQHKRDFLTLGVLGLVEKARPAFRNSKVGFTEEGRIVLAKIQHSEHDANHYVRLLQSKGIQVDVTCVAKIFARWRVASFNSAFRGELQRLDADENSTGKTEPAEVKAATPIAPDAAFTDFLAHLEGREEPVAHPGVFLFLPYLNRLRLFDKAASVLDLQPARSYSWFSLLLLNLGRIFRAVPSVSKACALEELTLPLSAGLVSMPCTDTLLNGLAAISEDQLLELRQYLTAVALGQGLVQGRQIAFDFKMRDFTGDDVELKNIGKGPSPKRKICFPGFRPHLAWDVASGVPISIEFRNGRARATTTIKRFIRELICDALGDNAVEHVYIDSEYTAEHVWKFIVDPSEGLGAELTMCVKQNRKVRKHIDHFLATHPDWVYYDDEHTRTAQTFPVAIGDSGRVLHCVLKRHERKGTLRCFGSTLPQLDAAAILKEYSHRWTIENGIKDLAASYYFDNIPGIDPHRVNIHYFVVMLARLLFEMMRRDWIEPRNADGTAKTLKTLRPEFISGVNGVISRRGAELVLTWKDHLVDAHHQRMAQFLATVNEHAQEPLPFLAGLRLRFELSSPRPETLRNQLRRKAVEF